MGRRGPKPKPKHLVKSQNFLFRLTETERAAFDRAAEEAGLNLSAWMRMVCLSAAKAAKK
jgi:hypothetical protein